MFSPATSTLEQAARLTKHEVSCVRRLPVWNPIQIRLELPLRPCALRHSAEIRGFRGLITKDSSRYLDSLRS